MTESEIRTLAEKALDEIERTPKGRVYASIKGIVAGVKKRETTTVFRRENGTVALEIVPRHCYRISDWKEYDLPLDLQMRATRMLNNL